MHQCGVAPFYFIVDISVFEQYVVPRLERAVGGSEREVDEKWSLLVAVTDTTNCLFAMKIDQVAAIRYRLAVSLKVAGSQNCLVVVVNLGVHVTVEAAEAASVWAERLERMTQMPFAYHRCLIASGGE